MIKTVIAAALALAALPASSLAQDAAGPDAARFYGTLGYSQIDAAQATLGAVTARGGWKARPWLGFEAEAGVGVEEDAFDVSSGVTGGVIELKHDVAAYAVAFMPIGDHVELFARAGYGSTRIEASTPAVTPADGASLNYGVGVSVFHGDNGLRADWTRKDFSDNDGEADSWSVSYIRRF
jgi:hypothetical protein